MFRNSGDVNFLINVLLEIRAQILMKQEHPPFSATNMKYLFCMVVHCLNMQLLKAGFLPLSANRSPILFTAHLEEVNFVHY